MKTSTTSRLVSSVRNVGVGLLLLGLLPGKTVAQDYIGAKAGLRQVAERNAKPADKSEPDEQSKLRDELSAFARTVTESSTGRRRQRLAGPRGSGRKNQFPIRR